MTLDQLPKSLACGPATRQNCSPTRIGGPGTQAANQIAIVLQTHPGVATWEREIMLERQREGIAKAKAEGKYKGRKPTVAVQAMQIRELHGVGEKPAHIARRPGIARSSVYRMQDSASGLLRGQPVVADRLMDASATRRQRPMKVKDQTGAEVANQWQAKV
jgi:hypothetical protein